MTSRFNAPDLLPVICVTYVCGCGRSATRYGRSAGELPAGWRELAVPGEDPGHLCERCAERADASERARPTSEP